MTNDIDLTNRTRNLPRRAIRRPMPSPGSLAFYSWEPLGSSQIWKDQVHRAVYRRASLVHSTTESAVDRLIILLRSTVRPVSKYDLLRLEGK